MHPPALRLGRMLLLSCTVAAMLVAFTAGAASADPSPAPPPSAPTPAPSSPVLPPTPGIYGPIIGGGTMAPPPAMGPGLAPTSGSDPSWWDVPGQIEKAIDTWFGNLVKSALEPVIRLIGNTLLTSPNVSDGRIAQVWTGVAVTANTLYVLLTLAGAVIVISHETVQTRHSVKEIAPRLVLGAIASNASLWAISQTVSLGNALAAALTAGKLDAEGVGSRLTSLIISKIFLPSGITQLFLVLLGGAVAVVGIVLLVTCMIRAALLFILTAGAPVALACHALPQTDGLARLWWRAIIGCLATQVLQALVLIVCMQVFFDPHADDILGLPTGSGLVDLLLALVLLFALIKIPIWTTRIVLGRRAMGATTAGRLARSAFYYKAFTLARNRLRTGPTQPRVPGAWHNSHRPGPPPPRPPGAGLAPYRGPRPSGPSGGPGDFSSWSPKPETVTVTASVVPDRPPSSTGAPSHDAPRPPRPHSPPPPTPLGPVKRPPLALPPGRNTRLDRLAKERARNPPPARGAQQHGLFPPITPTSPRPPKTNEPPPPHLGADLKHQAALPSPAPRKRTSNLKSAPLPLAPVFLAPSEHPAKRTRRRSPSLPKEEG